MITTRALWFATVTPDAGDPAGWLLGWQAVDLPMLLALPLLLIASGFCSASETALFSLSDAQRMEFRARGTLAGRAVDALLADQRMLLITVLLGNMTVNVLYFVITSVLVLRSNAGPLGRSVLGIGFLLVLIIAGEVTPKVVATGWRVRFAGLVAPLLLTIHRLIGPLRAVLAHGVVEPLSRLTAPRTTPPDISDEEIKALLDVSGREGLINDEEHRMLHEVLNIRTLRVRDVMTPRIRMIALPADAAREDVERVTREHRRTTIPIYGEDLDEILGVLQVKRFLLDPAARSVTDPAVMTEVHYVPESARLDQLLEQLRRWRAKSAVAVNEYGGTEGVVAVEDVVEELVGDIVGSGERSPAAPQLVGLGVWRVAGQMPVAEFATLFRIPLPETSGVTLAALVAERLGQPPVVGDRVRLDGADVAVTSVTRTRATWLTVRLRTKPDPQHRGEATP